MATPFLSSANPFVPSSSSSSQLTQFTPTTVINLTGRRNRGRRILCRALEEHEPVLALTKRSFLAASLFCSFGANANAAILEADDDEELLERVKRDRKKRLEKQGVISSSNEEKGYLQDVVYNLSKVGQAIDKNDLSAASSVLGGSTGTDWVQKANMAFTKLSSSPEVMTEVETFKSSLASLISSVSQSDIESSKTAFVASATAFEKWTTLTGLVGQLKGL